MLRDTLMEIKKEMQVVDRNRNKVGEITLVMFSDEDHDALGPETLSGETPDMTASPSWVDDFVQGLSIDTPIPETLQERLHREGFIRVHEKNFFGDKDYYVTINQVSNVVDETVVLNTDKESLMSF